MEQTFVQGQYIWSTEENTDDQVIKISLRCFGACFEIQYLDQTLSKSPHLLAQHNESLRIMRSGDDGDPVKYDNGMKEITRLWQLFRELLCQIAPKTPLTEEAYSLFDFLYAPQYILEAVAENPDSTVMTPKLKGRIPRELFYPPGQYISTRHTDLLEDVKCFNSRQVKLIPTSSNPQNHPCLKGPSKVIVTDNSGTETLCYFKACDSSTARYRLDWDKPWIHAQIASAIKANVSDIRVCCLHGVVLDHYCDVLSHIPGASDEELAIWDKDLQTGDDTDDPTSKRVVGILLLFIENKGTLQALAPWSNVLDTQRKKWADELEGIVGELHAAGLVWGDAKPQNVLVDREDRLWVVDLEGSYTPGWVDADKMETREGGFAGCGED